MNKNWSSKFKQSRSSNTKERLIDSAIAFFHDNGYYAASIRKFAKFADISVGSLYFYFKDMDELFLEVMQRLNDKFFSSAEQAIQETDIYYKDKKAWLRTFLVNLLSAHQDLGKLHNELKALYFEKPELAQMKDEQEKKTRQLMMNMLNTLVKGDLKVKNPEIAILILSDLSDAVLDRLTYGCEMVKKDELLDECVEVMYKYLFE
jgi:AcrR family transcriptional regulator